MVVNRSYFSWSQYSLWSTSKREFYKRYVLELPSLSNKFFDKGKELGEYLETGTIPHYCTDPLLEVVGSLVPKLDIMEEKIEALIEFDDDRPNIQLLSFIDSGAIDGESFLEYKSGKTPWTQELVDNHEQLDFYALSYYIRSDYNVIPTCKLIWIETEETPDGLRYTGQVSQFERQFTEIQMASMLAKIAEAVQQIADFEYVEMELEEELVDRYLYAEQQMKKFADEMETIKLEIQVRLDAENLQYASSSKGRFSITKRGTWVYSKDLTKEKKEFDASFKKKQIAEQKSEVAVQTFTESLRFSIIK